jgi:hypothetical protein
MVSRRPITGPRDGSHGPYWPSVRGAVAQQQHQHSLGPNNQIYKTKEKKETRKNPKIKRGALLRDLGTGYGPTGARCAAAASSHSLRRQSEPTLKHPPVALASRQLLTLRHATPNTLTIRNNH